MSSVIAKDLRISPDAYALYNRMAGMIQERSLEILQENLREEGKSVAEVDDVRKAYHSACQEASCAPARE